MGRDLAQDVVQSVTFNDASAFYSILGKPHPSIRVEAFSKDSIREWALLQELKPRWIILFDTDEAFVRMVEVCYRILYKGLNRI